jgi:signal transduction histidine kinase
MSTNDSGDGGAKRLADCFREGFESAEPGEPVVASRVGDLVLRQVVSWSGPLLWGLLVGGVGLPVVPAGITGAVIIAMQLVAIGTIGPKDGGTPRPEETPARTKLLVLAAVTALAAAAVALGVGPNVMIPGAVLFMASKAVSAKRANVAGVVAAVGGLMAMSFLTDPRHLVTSGSTLTFGHVVRDLVRFVLVLLLVLGARHQDRTERKQRARADAAEAQAARAADDERSRIARDLHDVVAHHVSVMTLQAEAARTALPPGAGETDVALGRVADAGRSAMGELRRLLGILRTSGAEDGGIAPQPGIAQIQQLVDELAAHGMPVQLTVDGSCDRVPAGVGLSAYRVVQEALTNARKHTRATSVRVEVRCTPAAVEVRVTDDGRVTMPSSGGAGHGLIGMQERVALVGGRLTAGPRGDGSGWRVEALLPVA